MKDFRDERLQDFEERAQWDPDEVSRIGEAEVILLHPLADDLSLLEQLDMKPDDCHSVDAYVRTGQDVLFLQITTTGVTNRSLGTYARIGSYEPYFVNLVVVVTGPIDSSLLKSVVVKFSRASIARETLTDRLVSMAT